MNIFSKSGLLILGLFSSFSALAIEAVQICTLDVFNDRFVEAGLNERAARNNVEFQCELNYGENSLFCKKQEAVCKTSFLNADRPPRPAHGSQPSVLPPPTNSSAAMVLYSQKNFTGDVLMVNNSIANLKDHGFDDKMRSFSIPEGWQVRFYRDRDFRGPYYTRGAGDLNANGFENTISSLEILRK